MDEHMNQILQMINDCTELELNFFIYEIEGKKPEFFKLFCSVLKTVKKEELQYFYNRPSIKDYKEWFEEQINAADEISSNALDDAIKTLAQVGERVFNKIIEMEHNTAKATKEVFALREIMKANFLILEETISDQNRGIEKPPAQKAVLDGEQVIPLPAVDCNILKEKDLFTCLNNRKSRRKYTNEPLAIEELSFLLWATQGIQGNVIGTISRRTVPSGGSRHPFETYLAVHNVKGLQCGIYRYLPFTHSIVFLFSVSDLHNCVAKAALDQKFVGYCAVTFIWSVIPYRCEWRYTTESKKIILQDSGHLCQNLYIACEAISCGTCAIGAYDQKLFDELLKIDGIDEFTVYVAPVGKIDLKQQSV